MDWIMDSVLDTIGLPNEQGIGLTAETDMCVTFFARLACWFRPSVCSYNLPAKLVGKDLHYVTYYKL